MNNNNKSIAKPIHIQVRKGCINTVVWAIKHGCKKYAKAAYYAAMNGDLELLKYLVEELGFSIRATVLAAAARIGHIPMLSYLHDKVNRISQFKNLIDITADMKLTI